MRSTHLCVLAGAAMLAAGCSGESLSVDNANARGSVGGLIFDAETRQPVTEPVTVELLAGGDYLESVQTEAGRFSFSDVPAGEFILTMVGPTGYQGARIRDEIPSSAGEFPTGNAAVTVGPIGLIAADQSLRVRVLDLQGAPVAQYELRMRSFAQYLDFTSGRGISAGEVLLSATTGQDGIAVFQDLPDFFRLGPDADDTMEILLPPLDTNGDDVYEFAGSTQVVRVRSLSEPVVSIVLDPQLPANLLIEGSTVPAFLNPAAPAAVIAPDGSIGIKFNLPLDGASSSVNVFDETAAPVTGAFDTVHAGSYTFISFESASLSGGQEYNVFISAISAAGGETRQAEFGASFFTESAGPLGGQAALLGGGEIEIAFEHAIGAAGGQPIVLAGESCVLFFDADLDGSGTVGDAPDELGNDACSIALSSAEPPQSLPVFAQSGYTRFWRFTPPLEGGATLPADRLIHVRFSRLGDNQVTRPDGKALDDVVVAGYSTTDALR